MKRLVSYSTLVFLIILLNDIAVTTACIHGRVIDQTTKQPIPNANIYLANTSIGTITNSEGYFEIKKIPKGTFDIIFSHVSYYYQKERRLLNHMYNDIGTIELSTKAYQLPMVLVEGEEESLWNDQYEYFVEEFIGENENADSTYIVDPYKIDFWENDGKLFASCDDPIEIINKSLGYRIKYFLDYFEASSEYTKFSGNSVFTPLSSNSKMDSVKWLENRDETYFGSFRHFITVLNESYSTYLIFPESDYSINDSFGIEQNYMHNSRNRNPRVRINFSNKIDSLNSKGDSLLNSNGFFIYTNDNLPWEIPVPMRDQPISINNLLSDGKIETERYLKFPKLLKIYCIPGYEEGKYPPNYKMENIPGFQSSIIELEQDSVMIDILGRYYDKFGIHTYGIFGQERISDMLPYEYVYNSK